MYSPLTMFAPHPDGTFTIGRSEWEMNGCPDPLTGERVESHHVLWLLGWDVLDNEVISHTGRFPSGAKVTVFND
jgi:hypothetical protein